MTYKNQVTLSENPLAIPYSSLLILVGTAGAGKSTFAQKNFPRNMSVSTDECREILCGSRRNQKISEDAFDLFYFITEKRLKNSYPTIVDSTALYRKNRQRLREIADSYQFSTTLIFFDLSLEECLQNDQGRTFSVGEEVIKRQFRSLQKAKEQLEEESYDHIVVLKSREEIDNLSIRLTDSLVERKDKGPFDIIGDIHGCYEMLVSLLDKLGYQKGEFTYTHPQGRKIIFLGDICDRGEENVKVFDLVYSMWQHKVAYYVPGNHCDKLYRYLLGQDVKLLHGLDKTVYEYENLTKLAQEKFRENFQELFSCSPYYLIFDDGKLVVSHAGILGKWIGQVGKKIRSFCLYGSSTGKSDEKGFPMRLNWANGYKGDSYIVYGHTPVEKAVWQNRTINIDLGAVFGGKLCALRYPEKKTVTV